MKLNYTSNSTTAATTKVVLPILHKLQVNKFHVK